MCMMCDGATFDDFARGMQAKIDRHGYGLLGVEGERPRTYTIGLVEIADHPEFVVAGIEPAAAAVVLHDLAWSVLEGQQYEVRHSTVAAGMIVGFSQILPSHLRDGLMAAWERYYEALGRTDVRLGALQVVIPDTRYGDHQQPSQPRLDSPSDLEFSGPW